MRRAAATTARTPPKSAPRWRRRPRNSSRGAARSICTSLQRNSFQRDISMIRFVSGALVALLFAVPAQAVEPFPASFKTQTIKTNGTELYVRVGGKGPAVVLLHGFGDTGDMWAPIAAKLVANHTVIVPDLRGLGLSAHPDNGYSKANEARDIAGIMDALKVDKAQLVTHDIGNMVGYALAAQYPARITRWVVIDAPLPGVGSWQAQLVNPKTWHFNFYGPDEERLVAGRERLHLHRFYNELSRHPEKIDEGTRPHYTTLYAKPHAMHDAFEQFKAFPPDGMDHRGFP